MLPIRHVSVKREAHLSESNSGTLCSL